MTGTEKNIAIVVNPTKENAKAIKVADSITTLLLGMNVKHTIFSTEWPVEWEGITEAWIIGGDGTMNFFANQYPNIHLPLTLFAGGTGNDFHWMLYGEMTIENQVELVLEATPKKIDAGICNGRFFLNGVGIGFDGAIVKDLFGKKKLAGKASYLLSILKNIIGYREKSCMIQMPEEKIEQDCFMISVANAIRYGGGFKVAPKASVKDQLLDVNIVGKIPPLKRIKYLPVIEKGGHLQLPFIQYRQVNKITITLPQKLHAHIDGEYIFETIFDIEILPNRFSFLC